MRARHQARIGADVPGIGKAARLVDLAGDDRRQDGPQPRHAQQEPGVLIGLVVRGDGFQPVGVNGIGLDPFGCAQGARCASPMSRVLNRLATAMCSICGKVSSRSWTLLHCVARQRLLPKAEPIL